MTVTVTPVVREVVVAAPPDTCFTTFVDRFADWWPAEHHLGEGRTIVQDTIEGRVGGRCYDVDSEGGECTWGTVLAYEPPTRLVIAWHIQADWTLDHDPGRHSEVEVTFTPREDGRTAVRLVHARLERHAGGEEIAASVGGPGGWGALLARFGDVVEGRPPREL